MNRRNPLPKGGGRKIKMDLRKDYRNSLGSDRYRPFVFVAMGIFYVMACVILYFSDLEILSYIMMAVPVVLAIIVLSIIKMSK